MNQTLWIAASLISVLGILLFGFILMKLHKRLKAVDETWQPVQLLFRYTADDVPQNPVGRRFVWLFLPMLLYAGLSMAVVTYNTCSYAWLSSAMYIFTVLAFLAGVVETLLLLMRKTKAAPVCGLIKWGFFALWTAGMFIGLFLRSWTL